MKTQFLRPMILRMVLSAAALLITVNMQAQWSIVDTAGFVPGGDLYQHVFIDSANNPYVSFSTFGHGQVMKYADSVWTYVGGPDITPGTAFESWSVATADGHIYFSYADGADAGRAAVMMYDGTSWTSIGSDLSAGSAGHSNMIVSATGIPYLSYMDAGASSPALYVKQYVAGSWITLGGTAIDSAGAGFPSLAIDGHDSVYIAYQDSAHTGVIVLKLRSTGWAIVDTAFCALPDAQVGLVSLAIDHAGTPYVAYIAHDTVGNKLCVSKFNGTHWVTVGTPGFSPLGADFPALVVDHSNVPYIVFDDSTASYTTSVMKYADTGWTYVGSPAFSSPGADFATIALDGNNNPYVAFINGSNGGTTVMKYPACTPASAAMITAADTSICKGQTTTLTAAGTLNSATNWYWYTGSCAGTPIDTGTSITIAPGDTTTYYVHGYGGCVVTGVCNSFTVNVDSIAQPTVSVIAGVVTSSATTGNQWYRNDTLITGATAATYSATVTGWYKVVATNAHGCSSASDSVLVTITEGIVTIASDMEISVYPCPATDVINVAFINNKSAWLNATMYLTDNLGRKVLAPDHLDQKNAISLQGLPAGVYFMTVTTPDGQKVLKITKL